MRKRIGKLGRRGKILAVLIAVMFIGVATAQLLPYFGEIETTANVEHQVVEIGVESENSITWHSYGDPITHTIPDTSPGGETFCFKQWVRNSASIPVDVTLDTNEYAGNEITTTYIVKTTDDNTIDNFGSRDNEVVAFPITSGLTLDDLFADPGLSYTYTILDGGLYDGASPIIAAIDLDDGRHIALFPGWGGRTGTHTLQFSDTVAHDTGGNNYVDFVIHDSNWIRFWSSNNQYGNWNYLKEFGSSTGGDLPLTGDEVVTRVAIQHQSADTGETDKLDLLTFDGITNNFAITENTPFTMQPGEQLSFYICYTFALKIGINTYVLTTTVDATEST